jgi:hypothetical protein
VEGQNLRHHQRCRPDPRPEANRPLSPSLNYRAPATACCGSCLLMV